MSRLGTRVRSDIPSPHSLRNRAGRVAWAVACNLLFHWIPGPFHGPRRALLRLFGASIASTAKIFPSVEIWAPWNLTMKPHSTMARGVRCYNVAPISIGAEVTVSQGAFLCTASHDYSDPAFPLISAPIHIGNGAWIGAEAFVAMGVRIGRECVIGARSVVTSDMPAGMVCAGHPCKPIKPRFPAETT